MCCLSGIPLIYLLSFVFSNALNAFAFINFLLFLLMSQVYIISLVQHQHHVVLIHVL